MASDSPERPLAVLVSVQLADVTDVQQKSDLEELGRLVQTLGYDVIGTVAQKRDSLSAAAVLGEGKLKELSAFTGGTGVVPSAAKEIKTKNRAHADWQPDHEQDEEETDHETKEDKTGKATVVVVDHEITPSQMRNLEKATGAQVLDRTGVIVDIFHRHAKSREARLQVEIARLNYVAPRLREAGGKSERQQGKGAG